MHLIILMSQKDKLHILTMITKRYIILMKLRIFSIQKTLKIGNKQKSMIFFDVGDVKCYVIKISKFTQQ